MDCGFFAPKISPSSNASQAVGYSSQNIFGNFANSCREKLLPNPQHNPPSMTLLPEVPTSKMPTATVPFSYAQAAKGQKATSTSTPPTPLTPAIPGSPSTGPQDPPKNASANDAPLPATLSSEPRSDSFQSTTQDTELNNIPAAKAPSVSDASCTTQNDSTPSLGTSSGESRRDDDTSSEFSAQRSVKGGKPQSGPHRRSHQSRPASSGAENKRNRRERKPKASTNGADNTDKGSDAAESVKEAPPKPELFEAPIPTVNPWHQRRDAQLAKAQQSSADQTAKPTAATPSTTAPQSNVRKGNGAQVTTSNSSKFSNDSSTVNAGHQKRSGESDSSRKNGTHHNKTEARRADPAPSDDAASWPTPDTATKEEKRKSTDKIVVEKVEKPVVEDQGALKGKQVGKKDWVKMDFVPTVNFQTPLPQHKSTRPRGGARGGREGTTRGGSHAANPVKDSNEKGTSPSSTSSTKANNGESRDAGRDGPAHPRGSSVPPMSTKRGSIDTPNAREQRKHSVPGANKSKDSSPNVRLPPLLPQRMRHWPIYFFSSIPAINSLHLSAIFCVISNI